MALEKPNLRDISKVGSKQHVLKGWKYAGFIGAIVGFIGLSELMPFVNFAILIFIFLSDISHNYWPHDEPRKIQEAASGESESEFVTVLAGWNFRIVKETGKLTSYLDCLKLLSQ